MCKCQECGNQFKVDFLVSDELWEEIKPPNKPEGGGLLCGSCIANKIEAIGEYAVYNVIREKW